MQKEQPLVGKNRPGLIKVLFGLNQKAPGYLMPVLSIFFALSFLALWYYTFPIIVPRIWNIYSELVVLIMEKGMLFELGMTLSLVSKAMFISVAVAMFISFGGAVTNVLKPIARVFPYFRFWSTLAFAPIMRIWIGSGGAFQVALLMFGIIPFLVTSFNTTLRNIEKDPLYDYARTMGFPEWKCVYYVVVRNKLAQIYIDIRTTFAVAWVMVPYAEIANRDSGGIGAMIFDYTRFVPGEDPYAASMALNMVVLTCGIIVDFLVRRLILTLKEERARNRNQKN